MSNTGEPTDIISFFQFVEPQVLSKLYQAHATILTLFRNLSPLARHYILRLLLIEGYEVERDSLKNFVLPQHLPFHHEAVHTLKSLRILFEQHHERDTLRSRNVIALHPMIKKPLKAILSGQTEFKTHPLLQSQNIVKLRKKSTKNWHQVIRCVCGLEMIDKPTSRDVKQLVQDIGLLNHQGMKTAAGFQFLYQNLHSQIWRIMMGFIKMSEKRCWQKHDVINFLFQTSFHPVGSVLPINSLTPTQKSFIKDLANLGFVFLLGKKYYSPSQYCKFLTSTPATTTNEENEKGYIIVETTFRVFAYTSSPMQINLLSEFCQLKMKLPNMVCGYITKEKVLNLLERGISVELILSYLKDYAHPQLQQKTPILPINVTDQIKLWHIERNRLKMTSSYKIEGFPDEKEFKYYLRKLQEKESQITKTKLTCSESTMDVLNTLDDAKSDDDLSDKIRTEELSPSMRTMLRTNPSFRAKYQLILQRFSWQGTSFFKALDKPTRQLLRQRILDLHTETIEGSQSYLIWYGSKKEKLIEQKHIMIVTPEGFKEIKRLKDLARRATQAPARTLLGRTSLK